MSLRLLIVLLIVQRSTSYLPPFFSTVSSGHHSRVVRTSLKKNLQAHDLVYRRHLKTTTTGTSLHSTGLDESIATSLYDLQIQFSQFITTELSSTNVFSIVVLYVIGLFASFSPCTLGMLPITLAYLGKTDESYNGNNKLTIKAICYGIGLALTFSFFGLSASLFGKAFNVNEYSDVSLVAKFIVSAVYVSMGLSLLEIIELRFPSIELNVQNFGTSEGDNKSDYVQAVLFGASSALLETPCTSPILAALLTFVSTTTSNTPLVGAALLFFFSLGYATPLVGAGIASGNVNTAVLARGSPWLINLFAVVLITYGSYECWESISSSLV